MGHRLLRTKTIAKEDGPDGGSSDGGDGGGGGGGGGDGGGDDDMKNLHLHGWSSEGAASKKLSKCLTTLDLISLGVGSCCGKDVTA